MHLNSRYKSETAWEAENLKTAYKINIEIKIPFINQTANNKKKTKQNNTRIQICNCKKLLVADGDAETFWSGVGHDTIALR